jgi:allantoicase
MSDKTIIQQPPHDENSIEVQELSHSTSITSVTDFVKTEACKNVAPKGPYAGSYANLCSESAGAKTLFATDDWFAPADILLKDGPPIFDPNAFCEQGKVMDGWETRRRREAGHDWCLIQLSDRAEISALEIDTAHFTGNNTPKISIEIADLTCAQMSAMVKALPNAFERLLHGGVQGTGSTPEEVCEALEATKQVEWKQLLPVSPLGHGFENSRMHYVTLDSPMVGTIIRVNYFPDGGVARLRVWGSSYHPYTPKTHPQYMPIETGKICTVVRHSDTDMTPSRLPFEYPELSSQDNGGIGLACSNKHYGEPWFLTQNTLGKDMGDGWETARHPDRPSVLVVDPKTNLIDSPLKDWAILKLGKEAENGVARVIIDTKHFRGNYPESVLIESAYSPTDDPNAEWFPLIPRTRMAPDSEHVFDRSLDQVQNATRQVTHIRISIFPDGGVSRLRFYG